MEHDGIGFYGDGEGLSSQRLGGLDRDFVGADAGAVGLAEGAAGGEVELPAMPGAAKDLAVARPEVFTGSGGKGHAFDAAEAERAALVRAAIAQGVEGAVDVEDADGAALDIDDLPAAGGHIGNQADDVACHQTSVSPYNSRAFCSKMRWRMESGSFGKAVRGQSKSQCG